MQVNNQNINTNIRNNQTSFKGLSNNKFLSSIDFADKFTSKKASMFLYTGCILSRLVNSRDKYEFKETLTRDSMGWASLFFAAAIFEKTVGLGIEKIHKLIIKPESGAENLFLSNDKNNKLPSLLDALNPFDKKFEIKSFKDIETTADLHLKKSLLTKKSILYVMSLGFAIGVVGIFIPWMNTITTKKDRKRELDAQKIQAQPQEVIKSPKTVVMESFLNQAKNKNF